MVIEGNRITLYTDECIFQPTSDNCYIVYTESQFNSYCAEYLFTNPRNYKRLQEVFAEGYPNIEIQVNGFEG